MGIDRIMVTPTITVDQDKYDNLIRIQERYERLTNQKCECISEETEHKNFDFGIAIKLIKEGKRVQREGWNGKNQYIELATGISYRSNNDEIIDVFHNAIESKAIAFVGTSGVQLGWLASQADMLAEDWKLVEQEENEEMNDKAKYTDVNEEKQNRIDDVRNMFSDVYDFIETNCKSSRETSLAITKIEEAQFWAIKGITREKQEEIQNVTGDIIDENGNILF